MTTTHEQLRDLEPKARELISKVCCDGQYVNESIEFIRTLLSQATKEAIEERERAVREILLREINRMKVENGCLEYY